ncbi:MAG: hypothetical protein KBB01_06690 [Candidatus Omnitrophica bacterium]|jgi:hypothetical protein|nr:hypothetical protein [Candidatus Omnitrophota bacterium]
MSKITVKFLLLIIFFSGCVKLRDYTGVKGGAFGLDIERKFGSGTDKKDYYQLENGEVIIIGDTKKEVIMKIGLPAKIEKTLDGYEKWVYESKEIELFFKGKRLYDWDSFRYQGTLQKEEK